MYIVYYLLVVAAAYAVGNLCGMWLYRSRCHASKHCDVSHSAVEQCRKIGQFLRQRRWVCFDGEHFDTDDTIRKHSFYKGRHAVLIQFIRVCHLYGCEVEIRQVTEERTSVHKTDDELITFMRPKFYEEQEYVV